MQSNVINRMKTEPLPILFSYVGWADRYDGTEPMLLVDMVCAHRTVRVVKRESYLVKREGFLTLHERRATLHE